MIVRRGGRLEADLWRVRRDQRAAAAFSTIERAGFVTAAAGENVANDRGTFFWRHGFQMIGFCCLEDRNPSARSDTALLAILHRTDESFTAERDLVESVFAVNDP